VNIIIRVDGLVGGVDGLIDDGGLRCGLQMPLSIIDDILFDFFCEFYVVY